MSDTYVREPPVDPDPLAGYDMLYRKLPKTVGFIEQCRSTPVLLKLFTARVPGEFYALDGDTATVLCPCKPDAPPAVPFNVPTPCTGECGRWFFFNLTDVLVAVMPDSPASKVARG